MECVLVRMGMNANVFQDVLFLSAVCSAFAGCALLV